MMIMFGMVMVSIFLLAAISFDLYFLGTARMQQQNLAEYVALATLRELKDPIGPSGGACPSAGTGSADATCYNHVISTGELAGSFALFGTGGASEVTPSQLQVTYNSNYVSISPDMWPYFQPQTTDGNVIFGTYNPGDQTFTPAAPGQSASVNCVRVRLYKQRSGSSSFVLPLMKLLQSAGTKLDTSVSSAAYATGDPFNPYMIVAIATPVG